MLKMGFNVHTHRIDVRLNGICRVHLQVLNEAKVDSNHIFWNITCLITMDWCYSTYNLSLTVNFAWFVVTFAPLVSTEPLKNGSFRIVGQRNSFSFYYTPTNSSVLTLCQHSTSHFNVVLPW